jgi:DGQHR domain-containing protein
LAKKSELQVRRVPALRFKQWLDLWDGYEFGGENRRKPAAHQFVFSMRAGDLRQLSDVYRRQRDGESAEGIQRPRDETRTSRIQRYVRYGYPYGDLKAGQRTKEVDNLRKPGWLPTAIVVNFLIKGDTRRGRQVKAEHLISFDETAGARIELVMPDPSNFEIGDLAPIEVIDGQHRLWAFDKFGGEEPIPDDFELPVVAYMGLDVAWQAYLFWSINVSPKKINPSHAFDLYPLLRTQDWLESVGELPIYREARSQELTEAMFTHPESVWKQRINMLGEKGIGVAVKQASWVRSLQSTFLGTGKGKSSHGLFQANLAGEDEPLEWAREQQAAFLIVLWRDLREALNSKPMHWWVKEFKGPDDALLARYSMLNQDQGVRAVLSITNDIFFRNAEGWLLHQWYPAIEPGMEMSSEQISICLRGIEKLAFRERLRELASGLCRFDWRSIEAPGVKEHSDDEVRKRAYRGSGGYPTLRHDVLERLVEIKNRSEVGVTAAELLAEVEQEGGN